MIQILGCYASAGNTWNAEIYEYCVKHAIPLWTKLEDILVFFDGSETCICEMLRDQFDKDTDTQIFYISDKEVWWEGNIIAQGPQIMGFECKATDLHASLIGGDVSYEDEVIQHLVRNLSLSRYGAIVAGPQESLDIAMFAGCCSKHGVNWNWCPTGIEAAVKKMFEIVENIDRVIDCRKPIYINKDQDVPQFALMLAQFWKMTGDQALKINDILEQQEYYSLADKFHNTEFLIENENLKRLWVDCYGDGTDPRKNLLKDPHQKKTKRSEKTD